MEIRFLNSQNKIETIKLEEGAKWSAIKANSIFSNFFKKVDNGDGIISKSEISTISDLIKELDYNQNNKLEEYELQNSNAFSKSYITARLIYNDLREKNSFGMPTTGKDIAAHVKQINKDNVISIVSFYKNNCSDGKEGIFDGILGEIGLPFEERKSYAKHIFSALVKFYKSQGVYVDDIVKDFNTELNRQEKSFKPANGVRLDNFAERLQKRLSNENISKTGPNGKIDANFKQGDMNDCWLISGIKAIANNSDTRQLLNKCIKVNPDGSVTVFLKGPNKKYTISKAELNGANEYSSGDLDVRAIEIAVNKYFGEHYDQSYNVLNQPDINSNSASKAFEILLGESNCRQYFVGFGQLYGMLTDINDGLIEKINSGKYLVVVAHLDTFTDSNISAQRHDGSKENIESNHAYSVVGADEHYIYIVNPWDTSEKLRLTHQEFKNAFNQASVVSSENVKRNFKE